MSKSKWTIAWTRSCLKKKSNLTGKLFFVFHFGNWPQILAGSRSINNADCSAKFLTLYVLLCTMPHGEELSRRLRQQNCAAAQGRLATATATKRFRNTSQPLDRYLQVAVLWKTTTTLPRSGRPSKLSRRTLSQLLREVANTPRMSSKDVQNSLKAAEVNVHRSTIRRVLNKEGFNGHVARRMPLLSQKHCKMRLQFAMTNLDQSATFWKNVPLDRWNENWTVWSH